MSRCNFVQCNCIHFRKFWVWRDFSFFKSFGYYIWVTKSKESCTNWFYFLPLTRFFFKCIFALTRKLLYTRAIWTYFSCWNPLCLFVCICWKFQYFLMCFIILHGVLNSIDTYISCRIYGIFFFPFCCKNYRVCIRTPLCVQVYCFMERANEI